MPHVNLLQLCEHDAAKVSAIKQIKGFGFNVFKTRVTNAALPFTKKQNKEKKKTTQAMKHTGGKKAPKFHVDLSQSCSYDRKKKHLKPEKFNISYTHSSPTLNKLLTFTLHFQDEIKLTYPIEYKNPAVTKRLKLFFLDTAEQSEMPCVTMSIHIIKLNRIGYIEVCLGCLHQWSGMWGKKCVIKAVFPAGGDLRLSLINH